MLTIEIKGLEEVKKSLGNMARQLPYATAIALNKTAKAVQKELTAEMSRTFDRPTPFIKKSLYIRPASKQNLIAEVGVKDEATKILVHQIYGGQRVMKRSEKWLRHYWTLGAGARLNQYGNISPGQITQILSVTKTHPDPYSWTTKRSRKRNKKLPGYFIIRKGLTKRGLHPGVWQRVGKKSVKPVLIFGREPHYRPRYKFFEVAIHTVRKEWNGLFNEALANALRTAR